MKDKYFLDTNILIYTFDSSNLHKQKTAKKLVKTALEKNVGVISYQVVQEFLNVATQKFKKPLSYEEAQLYLEKILMPLCEFYPTVELYQYALEIRKKTHFSFYDSLIISTAIKTHCKILYSEDLHDGQEIAGLTIKNPFH